MLDAGGGGGGTPWESMTVQAMQALIQNPDTEKHWDLVNGWKKSAELISEHRFQVQDYRDNLAAAWPPKRSKASAAYLARLDALIASLTETYEAALENHDAFSAATLSLSLAQTDMQKIFDEYQTNDQLLLDFNTKQEEQKLSGTPRPTPSPSGEQPPVAPGRQEELRQKAVQLLHGVSTELAQAQVRLVKPGLYEKMPRREDPSGADGSPYIAPPIPIIAANPVLETSGGDTSRRSSTTFPMGSSGSGKALPASTLPPSGSQPGLILGGTAPTTSLSPTTGISLPSSTLPTQPINPSTSPGMLPLAPRTLTPGGNGTLAPPTNNFGHGIDAPREGVIRSTTPGAGGIHAMPPGGIIGGAPGTGVGQPGNVRQPVRRINPIGGVIGDTSSPSRALGHEFPASQSVNSSTPYGQPGGRQGERGRKSESKWDPNNPWATAEGVDPVVMPSREQRIDPGPAIGLS